MKLENLDAAIELAETVKHSPVYNYITPGLTSWLLAKEGCRQRMFHMEREQLTGITPHSHRYDLRCVVLSGSVRNVTWVKTDDADRGDWFTDKVVHGQDGNPGAYDNAVCHSSGGLWKPEPALYEAGDVYTIPYTDIHSIWFERGTRVFVQESEKKTDETYILEPRSNGEAINTMRVEPWMFRRPKG